MHLVHSQKNPVLPQVIIRRYTMLETVFVSDTDPGPVPGSHENDQKKLNIFWGILFSY